MSVCQFREIGNSVDKVVNNLVVRSTVVACETQTNELRAGIVQAQIVEADMVVTDELIPMLNVTFPLTGEGIGGVPLTFAPGTVAGQVLEWNGTDWEQTLPTPTTLSDVGTGVSLIAQPTGPPLEVYTLNAGPGIDIQNTGSGVEIGTDTETGCNLSPPGLVDFGPIVPPPATFVSYWNLGDFFQIWGEAQLDPTGTDPGTTDFSVTVPAASIGFSIPAPYTGIDAACTVGTWVTCVLTDPATAVGDGVSYGGRMSVSFSAPNVVLVFESCYKISGWPLAAPAVVDVTTFNLQGRFV
jgi:hypothetical protein